MLTPRQQAVRQFIATYVAVHGYPPTVRELCAQFGIRSPNGMICHLRALERKGAIARHRAAARSIRLVGDRAREKGGPRQANDTPAVSTLNGRIHLDFGSGTFFTLTRAQALDLARALAAEATGLDPPDAG